MDHSSAVKLTQNVKAHLVHLAVLREYQHQNDNPYFKSALTLAIEDAQEAIARVASRLRQLGYPLLDQTPDETGEKLLRQARSQRSVEEKLKFVRHWLKHQLEWYSVHVKELKNDADTQATLVALAEQTRVRLERWENLMKDLKVPLD